MDEDVRLELAEEQQGQRARIGAADDAGLDRAAKVRGGDAQHAARRRVLVLRVEGNDERGLPRGLMHLHGDGGADHGADEGDELLGEAAEHEARIGGRVDARELVDEGRDDEGARAHRRGEEVLLGAEMAKDRGRRDLQLGRDAGERGGGEAALGEGGARGFEDLIAGDTRRTAHR